MDEEQEMQQALGQQARLVVTTVARLSEAAIRAAEVVAERRRALEEGRAAELTARFEAEQGAARSAYRHAENPWWWDRARTEEIAEVYQVATVWSDLDPEARRVEQLMSEEIQRRYEVDPRAVDLATVPDELAAAERARAQRDAAEAVALTAAADQADRDSRELDQAAERERLREAVLSGELTPDEATAQWPDDDPHKHSAEHAAAEVDRLEDSAGDRRADRDGLDSKADVAWDSAERREATARDLEQRLDDPRAVEARIRADSYQGKPATEATRKPAKSAKARPTRGQGAGRQRQQGRGR